MCMWSPPSLWLTTTDQCWPGIHRLPSQLAFSRPGIGMPEIWGKLTFHPNLRYHTLDEKISLREEDRLKG